jgi:hypothetical protein
MLQRSEVLNSINAVLAKRRLLSAPPAFEAANSSLRLFITTTTVLPLEPHTPHA